MIFKRVFRLASIVAVSLLASQAARTQESEIAFLRLNGEIAADGSAVTLYWPSEDGSQRGNAVVSRRKLGSTGAGSWEVIEPLLGIRLRYTDATTSAGIAYEYRVHQQDIRSGAILSAGYWATGVGIPAIEQRGNALVVVDETVAEPLARHLERFEMDLLGDGWSVRRLQSPRGTKDPAENLARARALQERIREAYWSDPFAPGHAIILIGHVPLPGAGSAAPDGHDRVAHGTDSFYADMDGEWPDNGEGILRHNFVPDGRIEALVGRIDFSNIPSPVDTEIDLLRSYFDRNHAWRHGLLGDLRAAYGQTRHLEGELHALDNIVGPGAVTTGGHDNAGEGGPWLLGVDFGPSGGQRYRGWLSNKAVFAINFGSGKQRIGIRNNAMNTLLALPWYPLAVGWGGRPTWRLHVMALGNSMGEAHLRTLNNGLPGEPYPETMEYLPTGRYVFRNPVWVNLLGDPTIRPFPLRPVGGLVAERTADGVRLTWAASASEGVEGYRIYRAPSRMGPYVPVDSRHPVAETAFLDSAAPEDVWYMVRAAGLQRVHAGSFHNLSQGRFASPVTAPVAAPDFPLSGAPGETVDLFSGAGDLNGPLLAPVRDVADGSITRSGDKWTFEPRAGFEGDIRVPYMASDGLTTAEGTITVSVGDP